MARTAVWKSGCGGSTSCTCGASGICRPRLA